MKSIQSINKLSNDQKEVLKRLEDFLCSLDKKHDVYLTINRLYDVASPPSMASLANILNLLVIEGLLRKVIRVQSPDTDTSLGDYDSVAKIPLVLHDIYKDIDIEVKPENLKILYAFNKDTNNLICSHNK